MNDMAPRAKKDDRHIVFLTRDPMVHQQSGSTTYALGLLKLLRTQGAEVTVVVTSAESRSPRLFFRAMVPLPTGVRLRCPGYLRLGTWYVLPLRSKAWARMLSRLAERRRWLKPLRGWLEKRYSERLFTNAWDLTLPTPGEERAASQEVGSARAKVVLGNYCLWGPVLGKLSAQGIRTAILMHDLLSARVRRFQEAGLPLDCPSITEAEEMRWLSGAQNVLAAQKGEAEQIRPRVQARVLVTPLLLESEISSETSVIKGRCVFVGSNIAPNRAGLEFLLDQVWPRVRAEVPSATLVLAGTVCDALKTRSMPPGVEPWGLVPSLKNVYAPAAVCLVPLVLGSGIKIKLLEALRFGKAIVSTSVGVEGLEECTAGVVDVADKAEEFAAAVIALLQSDTLRREQETAAQRLVQERFGPGCALDPEFVEALL